MSSIGHTLEKEEGFLNAHSIMYLGENQYETTLNKRYSLTCNTHAQMHLLLPTQIHSHPEPLFRLVSG